MERPLTQSFLLFSIAALSIGVSHAQDPYWDAAYSGGGSSSGGGGSLFGASELSYGYFDIGYFFYDFEIEGIDNANGFSGKLQIPIADTLFVAAGLDFASPDKDEAGDLDYFAWQLGGGIGLPIGFFDLVIEGGIAHEELTGDVFDAPFDGYGVYVAPGIRMGLGEVAELYGGLTFNSIDGDSDFEVDFRALLHLTPSISLFGEATLAEEINRYGAGLRINF